MIKFTTFFLSLLLFSTLHLTSQTDDWKFSGQVQIRTELDGRDFSNLTYPISFTSMRTRFGVERLLTKDISAFVQIQDSRVWGETKNTLLNAKNLDLHQGYVKFNEIFDTPLGIQAGRFEMHYRNGRILSGNAFNYIGRSWDGVRLSYDTKPFSIDLFGVTHSNSNNYLGSAIPDTTQYPYPSKPEVGHNLWGFWTKTAFDKEHYLDVFGYLDWNRKKTNKGNYLSNRYLFGAHYKLTIDNFFALLEAAYQGGEAGDQKSTNDPLKVSAYTGTASLNYKISDLTIGLNFDMMSGTSTDDIALGETTNTYDATYQGKHAFYGGSDYFSNISKGTGSRGLNDMFLKLVYAPKSSSFSHTLEAHNYMTNKPYVLQDGNESSELGQELYYILKYNVYKSSTLEWGASVFMPGDVMKDIYDVDKSDGAGTYDRTDTAFWTYVMLRLAL